MNIFAFQMLLLYIFIKYCFPCWLFTLITWNMKLSFSFFVFFLFFSTKAYSFPKPYQVILCIHQTKHTWQNSQVSENKMKHWMKMKPCEKNNDPLKELNLSALQKSCELFHHNLYFFFTAFFTLEISRCLYVSFQKWLQGSYPTVSLRRKHASFGQNSVVGRAYSLNFCCNLF